jgi:hypothetical protein
MLGNMKSINSGRRCRNRGSESTALTSGNAPFRPGAYRGHRLGDGNDLRNLIVNPSRGRHPAANVEWSGDIQNRPAKGAGECWS